ncbi:MAG: MarR family transcriptional regulator [Bacteroidota bacterium]
MKLEDAIKQKRFDNLRQKAVLNVMFTNNWLVGVQTRMLKPYGISLPQYNVLRILRGQYPNPANLGVLTERMLDRSSNASRLVERLRQKGFVNRTECPRDRRQVEVLITEKGLDLLKTLDGVQDEFADIFSSLTDAEVKTVSDLMEKMRSCCAEKYQ